MCEHSSEVLHVLCLQGTWKLRSRGSPVACHLPTKLAGCLSFRVVADEMAVIRLGSSEFAVKTQEREHQSINI
jgi:hypothetical protein